MNKMQQQERWFLEGAAALRRYLMASGRSEALPRTGDYYYCPCCMGRYGREALSNGLLTYEDVPPKSVGGRPLVLTCKSCNNTAGSRLDAQARLREEQLDFLAGRAPTGHWRPRSWLAAPRHVVTSGASATPGR